MFSPSTWREAARRVLGTHGERTALDTSGLAIPQVALVAKLVGGRFDLVGTIVYRCHTCGTPITRPWEVFFVDDAWASTLAPEPTTPTTTTHHAWHMAD